jgi:hypothetical protein
MCPVRQSASFNREQDGSNRRTVEVNTVYCTNLINKVCSAPNSSEITSLDPTNSIPMGADSADIGRAIHPGFQIT